MSALLGRARAAAHGEAASLAGVGDGEQWCPDWAKPPLPKASAAAPAAGA